MMEEAEEDRRKGRRERSRRRGMEVRPLGEVEGGGEGRGRG